MVVVAVFSWNININTVYTYHIHMVSIVYVNV